MPIGKWSSLHRFELEGHQEQDVLLMLPSIVAAPSIMHGRGLAATCPPLLV
jgi:hypothetical protein